MWRKQPQFYVHNGPQFPLHLTEYVWNTAVWTIAVPQSQTVVSDNQGVFRPVCCIGNRLQLEGGLHPAVM